MKPHMRGVIAFFAVLNTVLCISETSAIASSDSLSELSSDEIAERSFSVAESMKTSGYCYAGVSKALAPLGIILTGNAAYQAREQLLADSRFVPVSTDDNSELLRGDIIVFNKSASHPYGHICVYQGNGEESSDHVSSLSNPNAYGGVTVFRLRSDMRSIASADDQSSWTSRMPVSAPDFRSNFTGSTQPFRATNWQTGLGGNSKAGSLTRTRELVRREFRNLATATTVRSLKNRLVRFVLNNL